MSKNKTAIVFAILAAALYAINVPLSKLLLVEVSPTMLAGFLYLGAGVGEEIPQLLYITLIVLLGFVTYTLT